MPHDVLPWLEYRWPFDFPVGMYRAICERLRGTPARVEELVVREAPAVVSQRPAPDSWSVQEHAGHLCNVERLWQIRLDELRRGAAVLTAADMSNQATRAETYNDQPLAAVLARFRSARADTLRTLDALTLDDAARSAHHPRLDRSMRLVDLCYFAAEHDDHHLAVMRWLLA